MPTRIAMSSGTYPVNSVSWFVAMTTNGLGMSATIMMISDRCRPRDASALSSASRRASWSKRESLSIADLQVGDCLCGGVENALDGGAVDTTAELGDRGGEPRECWFQRRAGVESRARTGFDLGERVALAVEHAAACCGDSVRTSSAATLLVKDELLGAKSGQGGIDAPR